MQRSSYRSYVYRFCVDSSSCFPLRVQTDRQIKLSLLLLLWAKSLSINATVRKWLFLQVYQPCHLSVCLSDRWVSCGILTHWLWIPFGWSVGLIKGWVYWMGAEIGEGRTWCCSYYHRGTGNLFCRTTLMRSSRKNTTESSSYCAPFRLSCKSTHRDA